jgi:hypothetical protein
MKMHCADVLVVLRASTADWTVLYWPVVAVLLTTRHPDGGEVRPAAKAAVANEKRYRNESITGDRDVVGIETGLEGNAGTYLYPY